MLTSLRGALRTVATDGYVHDLTGADLAEFLHETCGIPQSYLDAWEPMAAAYYTANGGLANYTDEEKSDPRAIYLGLLVAWLDMYANNTGAASRTLTAADATGWSLVLAAAWANGERVPMYDFLDRWRGIGMQAWPYAAAGLSPRESWQIRAGTIADDALRAMAALRGVILPAGLPNRLSA